MCLSLSVSDCFLFLSLSLRAYICSFQRQNVYKSLLFEWERSLRDVYDDKKFFKNVFFVKKIRIESILFTFDRGGLDHGKGLQDDWTRGWSNDNNNTCVCVCVCGCVCVCVCVAFVIKLSVVLLIMALLSHLT